MKKKITASIFTLGLGILLVFIFIWSQNNISPQNNLSLNPSLVAIVNGASIKRQDFEKELNFKKNYLNSLKASQATETGVETEVLERMIDEKIVLQYATARNISVTDEALNQRYQELIRREDSEEKYLEKIKSIYGISKEDYLAKLRLEVLNMKVQEDLKRPLIDYLQEQKKKIKIERAI